MAAKVIEFKRKADGFEEKHDDYMIRPYPEGFALFISNGKYI